MIDYHCEREEPEEGQGMCEQDVHRWFELSYSSYLVLPRSLMQAMPAGWQHRMVRLLDEMQATFLQENDHYTVLLRGEGGRFVRDPFGNYRYPDSRAIDAARRGGTITESNGGAT